MSSATEISADRDGDAIWRAAFLLAALAPAALLGANRTGIWLAEALAILALLILRRPSTPTGAATWLWVGAMAFGLAQAATISIRPDETIRAVTRLGVYGGAFALAWDLGRGRNGARALLSGFAVWTTALSVYGIAAEASGFNPILGALEAYPRAVEATFVNRNAFALYAGFGVIAALATAFGGGGRQRSWLAAALICALAVALTGSRGGAAATAVGIAVFAVLSGRCAWLSLAPAPVAAVFAFAGPARMDFISEERFEIQRLLIGAIRDGQSFGVGLGAFQDGFRPVAATAFRWGDWDHAHNMYLETAFELGPFAAPCLILPVIMLTGGAARRARGSGGVWSAAAAGAGAAAGAHSLVDFSLAIPAVATALALFLGAGLGARRRRSTPSSTTQSAAETRSQTAPPTPKAPAMR